MSETSARLSPREQWQQQVKEADERMTKLATDTTQREWLTITTALDRTRQQIGADNGLTLLAMAWVQEKRAHGGASWDRLLDMTDDQLATLLGFPEGDQPAHDAAEPAPTADQIADDAIERANAHTTDAALREHQHGTSSAQIAADASTSAQGGQPA